jgi:hypothetical protein
VIRRTTVAGDPSALGLGVLAFVLVQAGAWVGDDSTRARLAALPEVEEAHVIAGRASLLLKVRTASPRAPAGHTAPDLPHGRDHGHRSDHGARDLLRAPARPARAQAAGRGGPVSAALAYNGLALDRVLGRRDAPE